MNDNEIQRKLRTEPYFINMRKFGYDLRALEERYATEPDGVPGHIIAQALNTDEADVHSEYQRIAADLQEEMGAT